MKDKYFKILNNGKSCHGGNFIWSLPTLNEDGSYNPGEWHEIEGELQMCWHGFHLTEDISKWVTAPNDFFKIYEVEIDETKQILKNYSDKIVVQRLRLIKPFTGINEQGKNQVQCLDGQLHTSNDTPSLAQFNGKIKCWHKHGKLHRENNPAVERIIGTNKIPNIEYWKDGRLVKSYKPFDDYLK